MVVCFFLFFIGLLCDLLWSDPDKDITGWSENDRGVSFTFGPDVVSRFLQKHDMDLICRAHQVSFGEGCFFLVSCFFVAWFFCCGVNFSFSVLCDHGVYVLMPMFFFFCRSSRTGTSSLQRDIWSHYFRRQITVESLTMRVR